MTGRKRKASNRAVPDTALPEIYQDMLAEAGASCTAVLAYEPPRKRRRPGEKAGFSPLGGGLGHVTAEVSEEESAEPEETHLPTPNLQMAFLESDDEYDTDDEEIEFEDVIDFGQLSSTTDQVQAPTSIELNLTAHKMSNSSKRVERRKPLSRVEKGRRLQIHQTHLLCLLVHCSRRNRWCNDSEVQEILRPLLTPKILTALRPRASLSQFGMTESLKDGLQQASKAFKASFQVTERGLRRCLWAEDQDDLNQYELPDDMDSCISVNEFREAARNLRGSRDVGAQLFCALLRLAGLQCRLVCSLQPLACVPGGPTLQSPRGSKEPLSKPSAEDSMRDFRSKVGASQPVSRPAARRRFGNSNTTVQSTTTTPSTTLSHAITIKPIKESPYPVYWVEVLDVAHQKWQALDPLVTGILWKPAKLEPPASDRENCMCYVMAFESDGTAREVTRRYAKAYTSKTRKMRLEGLMEDGSRWWYKALKPFARKWPTNLDQIESNELLAIESREPMPRNVADFKDHPVYALERHLRRHEVILPGAQPMGTIGAGSRATLEKIFRRKDVRIARSRDKWYMMGREVRPMELPVKFLPRRANARSGDYVDDGYGGNERDAAGTPLFMPEQTEQFRHPPVVGGRVPKNKFGNIDLYVLSMVPQGGVYIADETADSSMAAKAAYIMGIDYAPALTGFRFKGRQGTAIINGVVVAKEHEDAVLAVVEGLEDAEVQRESEQRAAVAVRMWKRFVVALRIRERIYMGVDSEERALDEKRLINAGQPSAHYQEEEDDEGPVDSELAGEALDDAPSDVTEEYLMDEEELGGGGFFVD